jgi:hypothetical protein
METDRRHFLGATGALLLAPALLPRRAGAAASWGPARFLSGFRRSDGSYSIARLSVDGRVTAEAKMPGRPHAIALSADGSMAAAAARRPGTYLLVLGTKTLEPVATITAAPGRHFYGHTVFSPDGSLLYATENDYDGQRGVIGIYDLTSGGARLGEMSSHGTGPHDIRLHPDGHTLIVANGGIATHPDAPRVKLNLATMAPNLSFVDRASGTCVASATLPAADHQLSIRHLSVSPTGRIAVGMQFQGPRLLHPPLLAIADTDGGSPERLVLSTLDMPQDSLKRMKGYCGSVAFDRSGRFIAATSPRGGLAVFFDMRDRKFLTAVDLSDCCGVAAGSGDGQFVLTAGTGAVRTIRLPDGHMTDTSRADGAFDNHLTGFPAV